MRSLLASLASALVLGLVPSALGQTAPEASLAVSLPSGPAEVALGSSHDVGFDVTLTLRNLVCASTATVRIPLSVKDQPSPLAGVKGTPTPAELVFDVPPGSYSSSPYSKTASANLRVAVDASGPAEHEHAFVVTATYAGGLPTGCQGAGQLPAADASGTHAIVTGKAAGATNGPTHQMGDGTTMGGAEHAGSSQETPMPGLVLVLVALLAVGLLRRR